jgi:hypothetical protein
MGADVQEDPALSAERKKTVLMRRAADGNVSSQTAVLGHLSID